MRPSYLDSMSWAMAEVYEAVTDRLLINLAKYFPYVRQSDEIKGSFEYQARMLAQMGQVNRESAQIIIDSMAGADAALRSTLDAAIMDALKNEEPKLRHAAEKGLLPTGKIPKPIMSANQMNAFQAYYRQSADKLNLVNTVMLESTQNAYISTVSDIAAKIGNTQRILNTGTGEVVTGVSSWNSAVHTSVQKMLDNGLTGFIDHGGHRWSPEAYAAMDIRTTVFNTARDAVWERANDYGCDLYQVSSHNAARPLCYPWQAKVISRNDWTGEVQDYEGTTVHVYAQSETSYGEAAGLFGVNCKHYPMTFIPGFSSLRGQPQDEEENEKAYELSQKQRGLERRLREEKRDLEVMKAQGASEEQIAIQKRRVRAASADIDDFCDENGLPRRRNRETAPIRATWVENPAAENSPFVERYQGDYIPVNQPTPTEIQTAQTAEVSQIPQQKQQPTTLQMHNQAVEWATENYYGNLDELKEGYATAPKQLKVLQDFEREIPHYESQLKEAIEREDFSIRTPSEAVENILRDGRFKTQMETNTSEGYLDIDLRKRATQNLFAYGEPIQVGDNEYEIYGYLDKASRANMYGDSRFVLKKQNLIDRTTVTVGDSLEMLERGGDPTPTKANNPKIISYGQVWDEGYPPTQERLDQIRQDFDDIEAYGHKSLGGYVELQFHGGVALDDVDYVVVSKSAYNADEIARLAEEKGVDVKWTR